MIVLKCIGIFYAVCLAIAIPVFIYGIKHAKNVPQDIVIYDL
jgi:hypothetical protein